MVDADDDGDVSSIELVITKISNTYFCSEFEEHLESMNKAS